MLETSLAGAGGRVLLLSEGYGPKIARGLESAEDSGRYWLRDRVEHCFTPLKDVF